MNIMKSFPALLLPVFVLVSGLITSQTSVLADGYRVTDKDKIYHGKEESPNNPAVLKSAEVFEEIPEWQEIQKRGLDKDDPEYWKLLEEANQKFYEAVRTVCNNNGYDSAGEVGSIEPEGDAPPPPNVTDKVIEALPDDDDGESGQE